MIHPVDNKIDPNVDPEIITYIEPDTGRQSQSDRPNDWPTDTDPSPPPPVIINRSNPGNMGLGGLVGLVSPLFYNDNSPLIAPSLTTQ